MRVLIVSQYYYPEPFSVTAIAEFLTNKGHVVTVLTSKPNYGCHRIMPGYEKIDFEIINGVRVIRVNGHPRKESKLSIVRNYLSFWHKAKRKVGQIKEEYDVVLSVSLSPVIMIAPAIKYAKKHRKNHVLFCLDLWPEALVSTGTIKKDGLAYKLMKKWSAHLYNKTDQILISSPSFKTYFKEVIKYDESKCQHLPQPSIMEVNPDIASHVFDKEYFNIVYCGNLGKLQNLDLIIKSAKLLKEKLKIRFHIIGLGSQKNQFLEDINFHGLTNEVIYLGGMSAQQASPYLKGSDALYLALKTDSIIGKTIPNKLSFYMQFAKPIIGAISGDGEELLKAAEGSIIVSDEKDVAFAVEKLLNMENEKLIKLGENNLKYYNKHLKNDVILDELEKVLLTHAK